MLAATVLIFNFLIPVKLIGIKSFFPLEHVINRTPELLCNYAHGEFCERLFRFNFEYLILQTVARIVRAGEASSEA